MNPHTHTPPTPKQRRGFASMDPARQRAIASKGGRVAQACGTGHRWTSAEARIAGQRGSQGRARHANGTHIALSVAEA